MYRNGSEQQLFLRIEGLQFFLYTHRTAKRRRKIETNDKIRSTKLEIYYGEKKNSIHSGGGLGKRPTLFFLLTQTTDTIYKVMMMIIPSRSNNLTTHFPLPLLELMKEINEKQQSIFRGG